MFKYAPLYRPAPFSSIPKGWEFVEAPHEGVNRPDLPRSKYKHGVIAYKRELTAEEVERNELEYLGEVPRPKHVEEAASPGTVDDLEIRRGDLRDRRGRLVRTMVAIHGGIGTHPDYVERFNAFDAEERDLSRRIQEIERPAVEAAKAQADALRERHYADKQERIAALPVYQRRNGWEIVKDGPNGDYYLRDPGDRMLDIYHGSLKRCREVADESKP